MCKIKGWLSSTLGILENFLRMLFSAINAKSACHTFLFLYIPITLQDARMGECKIWKLSVILDRKIDFFLPILFKKPIVALVNSENVA